MPLVALPLPSGATAFVPPDSALVLPAPGSTTTSLVIVDDRELLVSGSPAAVAALLNAGGATIAGMVDAAGGLVSATNGVASVVRTGVGEYTVTLDEAPAVLSGVLLSAQDGTVLSSQNGTIVGASFNVLSFDDLGASSDGAFTFQVVRVAS